MAAWFQCELKAAGAASDGIAHIRLKDVGGAFDERTFLSNRKEILATALVALSSTGLRVDANLETTDEFGQINLLALSRR